MKGPGSIAAGVIGLWFAAILQISLAPRLAIGVGAPDFFLALVACLGVFLDRRGTLLLSFGAGWLCGSLAGVNLTIYVISRCLVGYLLGSTINMGVQRNYFVAAVGGVAITLLGQLVILFLGAHHGAIIPYLGGTLVTSIYDGVIAGGLFLLVNRFANPRRQDRY